MSKMSKFVCAQLDMFKPPLDFTERFKAVLRMQFIFVGLDNTLVLFYPQ